ncbi:MAG: hypothetical protein ING44_05365 [Telmatospirillum sp.]|nr:hypothetical protein [Telmatospirillum sp.]
MRFDLLRHEVVPFFGAFAALVGAALLADAVLHLADAVWVGRYLGILGTLLILGSFGYSLRKRGFIAGAPTRLLRVHEWMAWAGSWLILVHAGIHFDAILAWLAVAAMLVNIASGLTGKFLLRRARVRLEATIGRLDALGLPVAEREARLHWDAFTFDIVRQWRAVHYPITLAFATLAAGHIAAIFVFWGWR